MLMVSLFRSAAPNTTLSIADVAAKVAQNQMILIDVREIAEVRASGKADGAVVMPLSVLPLKADPQQPDPALRKGVPIAAYCASGARSGRAAQILAGLGYGPVSNLGGLGDWKAGGGKVVPF
jgi:rhodanese-related sulfurtransferase